MELQMAVDIVLSGGESQPLGKDQLDGVFGQCQLLCEGEQSRGRGRKEAAAPKTKSFCSVRYGTANMIHFCNLVTTTQFASMNIAIIGMVNHTDQSNQSNVSTKRHPGAAADIRGMNFSALPAFWPRWAPPLERTQLSTIGLSGTTMGNFIVVIGGGFLCESPGWPSIFYIFGGIGCVFSIIWFSVVHDDPMKHPFISDSEREYIISSLAEQVKKTIAK
uniref:Sodium-dependent phosphate transport protein 1-like n=1 Tax=Phascolarctos cinereus TaxID=38626 RepID=A0A6P5LRY8_PHACI|nr:sodium-dependent phosphate transport protein 1-like [Phascolarctos cinereus]